MTPVVRQLDEAVAGATVHVPAGLHRGPWRMDKSVTLIGAGAHHTALSGEGLHRALEIDLDDPDGQVTLQDLTLRDGRASTGRGGLVSLRRGGLRLLRCRLLNSRAVFGGAVNIGGQARATVEHCVFCGHHADKGGGAVAVTDAADVTLVDVAFEANRADDAGHHLYVMGVPGGIPTVRMTRVSFTPCPGRGTGIANVRGFEGRLVRVDTPWPEDSLKVPQHPSRRQS